MRVCLLTNEFPPHIFGGVGTFVGNLADALADQGLEIVVISGCSEKLPRRVVARTDHPFEIVWVPRGIFPPRHLWFQLRNLDLIKSEIMRCDAVHGQDWAAYPMLDLCRKSGIRIPWVVTFHTDPRTELSLTLSAAGESSLTDFATYVIGFPLADLAIRTELELAERSVCVSHSLREELRRHYGLEKSAASVIPAPVNVADLDKVASRTSRGSSKKVRLYSAGRLYYRKGLISLLRIIRRLIEDRVTNFDLQMFGSGPLERALRSYIRRKGIARYVTIRGHVPREILIREFADSDIMCFPSLYEACPLAMIEAMAMGKPVVAFDLPFAREILGDDSEPLLARDIVDFSNKVAYLIDSKRERTRLGRMLARRAKAYDVRRTATAYRAIYEELVS